MTSFIGEPRREAAARLQEPIRVPRVCFVNTSGSIGGPIASMTDLIEGLRVLGTEISVLLPEGKGVDALRYRLGVIDVKCVDLPHGLKRDGAMAGILRDMAAREQLIIHANSTSALRPALLATLGTRVPLVVHLRNSALTRRERLLLRAARITRGRLFHAIAVSSSAERIAGRGLGSHVTVVPNPVRAPLPRGFHHMSSPVRVGAVLGWGMTKGFDRLVRVADATRDLSLVFQIFGMDLPAADTSFKSRWYREADRLGLSPRLVFHGRPPSLHSEYQKLDVALIVSRRESFGRVAAEAMRAGVPVIAPDIDGLRETVAGGRYAQMYQPSDDAMGAALALRAVLDQPAMARRKAREAQIWAERFDPSHAAATLRGVYESLVTRALHGNNEGKGRSAARC